MTIALEMAFLIIAIHFFADFVFQTSQQATNKSKSNIILFEHVLFYSAPFLIFGIAFALITLVTHFVTDYVSSRMTTHYHNKGNRRAFFIVVGADQAIHMMTLLATFAYLQ